MRSIFLATNLSSTNNQLFDTKHPTLFDWWRIMLRKDYKEIKSKLNKVDGKINEYSSEELILHNKKSIYKYSIYTTETFLSSLKGTQDEDLSDYAAVVSYDGAYQGTIGNGKQKIHFNYWSTSKLLLSDTFANQNEDLYHKR